MDMTATKSEGASVTREELDSVVIRFAGDSGDGMQLTGSQFGATSALMGNDLATFPDYPAEIRAPAGTTYGVSGFQVHFASKDIRTPGDAPDVLVAMNPAALMVNLPQLKPHGVLVINTDAFTKGNLKKAGYESNPLEDHSLDAYRLLAIDITKRTMEAVRPHGLSSKDGGRCKNVWTLGLLYWLFDRDPSQTSNWLDTKFAKKPDIAAANKAALRAGNIYAENTVLPNGIHPYTVPKASLPKGLYRSIDGNTAAAYGVVMGAKLAGLPVMYGSYPITPASALLHHLAKLKHMDVTTFQAEDEIAAVCSAIGASFGGALGVTGTSGPGLALKTEAVGLAIGAELPLVIVNVQRGGPSTGLPTKTEQSDLLFAIYGRNGDAPLPVLAAATPGDCFHMAVEAVRIATQFMTPVILLTDGYLANSAEPWKIPDLDAYEPFPVTFQTETENFQPFAHDPKTGVRRWVKPGTPGLMFRTGGLEKADGPGNISYDSDNHQVMTDMRANKIACVADSIPEASIEQGDTSGELLYVG
jgi:2-oxoglutarate ferredoxin oxidoreductase subunit alpha